ncbi:MAG: DUF4340 domain-containing protein [Planctomycetota bacterium]|nr:DUF4340 domain-containing protein [Planctomycetota bacterium]
MSRLTLVLLLAFVAGLGFLAWRQGRADQDYIAENDIPLFSGLDVNEVQSVLIDSVEHALQMRFERDPKVGWMMVDPMRSRAENGILELLVKSAVSRRGTPVPVSEAADLGKLGLSPARIVLELVSKSGAKQTIKVGAVDLDRNRVHVLVGGKVVRAVRDFETLLELGLDEYQSHNALIIEPREIVEFHRRGSMRFPDTDLAVDVALDAVQDNGDWRSTAPVQALLDPVQMAILVHGGAGLRFDNVVATAGAALSSLGLDPPALTLEFKTIRDETAILKMGPFDSARPGEWNGTAVGDPTVWRFSSEVASVLSTRIGDLLDHRFSRIATEDIAAIHMSTAQSEVKLVRSIVGWGVMEANPGSEVFAPPLLADPRKVADFLAQIGSSEIREFKVERAALDALEVVDKLRITTASGVTLVGSFGGPHASGGVRFQREGDEIVGVVDEAFRDLVRSNAQSFWSTTILETSEIAVVGLSISRGESEKQYSRDRTGVWIEKGRTSEAKELHPLLDPLLFLRAKMHLPSLAPNIEAPVRVRWESSQAEQVLEFGRITLDGQVLAVCDFEGRRSLLERPDLVDKLEALLTR